METVNKQLLDALKCLIDFYENPASFSGKTGEQRMLMLESQAAKSHAAIHQARQAIAAAEQGQPEPRCACGDSFTSDAVCANCLAAPQQAELVTKTDTSLITAADAALRYIAAMHSAEVPLEPFSAAVTAQALASALHPHKTPVGREADSKMVMAISTTQQQAEPVCELRVMGGVLSGYTYANAARYPEGTKLYAQPPAVAVAVPDYDAIFGVLYQMRISTRHQCEEAARRIMAVLSKPTAVVVQPEMEFTSDDLSILMSRSSPSELFKSEDLVDIAAKIESIAKKAEGGEA